MPTNLSLYIYISIMFRIILRVIHRIVPNLVVVVHGNDLFVKIYARNNDHLLTLIQTQIKPLGLIMSKIIISFRTVYNKQLTILPK